MTPFRAPPSYPRWVEVAALIHDAFAYMEAVLGHPAQAMSVTPAQLARAAETGTAYLIEDHARPVACLFTRPSRDFPGALYLGWLAVDAGQRGQGLAQRLMTCAITEARDAGFAAATLDTGRALTDLRAFFRRAGFEELPGDGEIVSFRTAIR